MASYFHPSCIFVVVLLCKKSHLIEILGPHTTRLFISFPITALFTKCSKSSNSSLSSGGILPLSNALLRTESQFKCHSFHIFEISLTGYKDPQKYIVNRIAWLWMKDNVFMINRLFFPTSIFPTQHR